MKEKIKVIAKDKVRLHGVIMVPGDTYELTKDEMYIYKKHVDVVKDVKTDQKPTKAVKGTAAKPRTRKKKDDNVTTS